MMWSREKGRWISTMNNIIASLEAACDRLKLGDQQKSQLRQAVEPAIAELADENARMKALLDEVARLVKATGHDRIIHDLRNVLNELVLLQALAEQGEDAGKV
jgi:hypothetical protein